MASHSAKINYGWIVAATGTAVIFASLGLGRFSLGMLLPSMGLSLGMSYSQMGIIGTANFVGYLAAVALAGVITRAAGFRWTIASGLTLVGGTMIFISHATTFQQALPLYIFTGIGSGLANVPMMGLVSHWFRPESRGRAAGIMVAGNGIGITFSGIFVPWVLTTSGPSGWRSGWLTMGIMSLFTAIIAARYASGAPTTMNLKPVGTRSQASPSIPQSTGSKGNNGYGKALLLLASLYCLFGLTHSVYTTFIVTTMVNERGFNQAAAGTSWAVIGVLSIFSGPIFGWLSDRLGRRPGVMIVYALFTLSYGLVAADLPPICLFASNAIFGLTVFSVPTILAAAVGDYVGPERSVMAFGFVTLFLGAGQIVGPAVAGVLADTTGTFRSAFWLCALITAGGIALARFLKPNVSGGI